MPKSLVRVSRTKKSTYPSKHRAGQFCTGRACRESAAKGRRCARECTWRGEYMHASDASDACVRRVWIISAAQGACILRPFSRPLPQGDDDASLTHSLTPSLIPSPTNEKTVGIRDMCVPTHAVLVACATQGGSSVMFGQREGSSERGRRTAVRRRCEGWKDDRTYIASAATIRQRWNPWEYRACACEARSRELLPRVTGCVRGAPPLPLPLPRDLRLPGLLCTRSSFAAFRDPVRVRGFLLYHVARGIKGMTLPVSRAQPISSPTTLAPYTRLYAP